MEKEIYRDCLRNHACYLGGYAIDGCSEFIPSNTMESDCKACGCHRNYHRKVLLIDLEQSPENGYGTGTLFWSLREAKRTARQHGVFPAASSQVVQQNSDHNFKQRKSKFTRGQREAMRAFADSLAWTMRNKGREAEINRFCEIIGVSRLLFKTRLNNNKKFYFNDTVTTSGANSSSTKAV